MLVVIPFVMLLLQWSILLRKSPSIPIIRWINPRWVFLLPLWWCKVGRWYLLIQVSIPRVVAGYVAIQVL